jgi:uncharacterized membrane protein
MTGLSAYSLWYDEGGSLAVATAEDFVATLAHDRHPPLSFVALRGWIRAFGEDDATLRALPALVSCATLAVFAAWARRFRSAAAAVALFAVAPFQVWHGQELRMYAWVELGAVLALLGTARSFEAKRASGTALVACGTFLAAGSHYLGALIVPAIAAAAHVRRREIGWRGALQLVSSSLAGVLLWLPWFLSPFAEQLEFDWGRHGRHDARALLELPVRQVLTGFGAFAPAWQGAIYALGGVLAAGWFVALARALRRSGTRELELVVLAAVPIAAAYLADAVLEIGFLPKYAIVAAPAVTLAAAEGLTAIRPAALGRLLVAIAVAGSLSATLWLRSANRFEDFRGASREVAASWRPGDRIVVVTGTPEPFASGAVRHYLREQPELLSSLVAEEALDQLLAGGLPREGRLHVVHRASSGAVESMRAIEAALDLGSRGRRRVSVEHSLWRAR